MAARSAQPKEEDSVPGIQDLENPFLPGCRAASSPVRQPMLGYLCRAAWLTIELFCSRQEVFFNRVVDHSWCLSVRLHAFIAPPPRSLLSQRAASSNSDGKQSALWYSATRWSVRGAPRALVRGQSVVKRGVVYRGNCNSCRNVWQPVVV